MRMLWVAIALVAALASPASGQRGPAASPALPFAETIARLSEPDAYFDTDNLISNEASYLHVSGRLRGAGSRGGAYLGVGPDQNFSYIAQVRPEIAILVDIRRDNLLQHLLFKALFTLADDRASYLGLLTARRVAAAAPGESVDSIVERVDAATARPEVFDSVHGVVRERLLRFGYPLSAEDLATIRRIHARFAAAGLDLRFQSHGRPPMPYYPTLRQLILERDLDGRRASYLASDEDFRFVRSLQLADRVVPVVGDLAGDKALPAIARLLRDRGSRVTAFYTSNVEFYLARDGRLGSWVQNVRALPRDPGAVVIRSVFRLPHPQSVPGYASTQLLQPMDVLVGEFDAGRIRGYSDLVTVGSLPLR